MQSMHTPPDDADASKSNRRKACDLCFTKKIKCDMLKPVCSNCILYQAECRTSIIRRKANPPKTKSAAAAQPENRRPAEGMEDRLARIEVQLQQVLQTARDAQTNQAVATSSRSGMSDESHLDGLVMDAAMQGAEAIQANDGDQVNPWKFDPVQPLMYEGPGPEPGVEALHLPPLEEILPTVDHYFSMFNLVIPLFHQPTFMKMLRAWYTDRTQRDRGTWAAVQIVLALGFRTPRLTATDTPAVQTEKADICLKNAQSIVSELVTREGDLLGVQILVGIVMLFQNSRDPKPAAVIIGTAVRLAHRLRLHAQDSVQWFTKEEAEQRSRVFWLVYTLDKDISLRALTPSTQFDDDIDIPLPALAPADSAGLIWTQNGQMYFNYHRRRVELAHIEGKVYDLLYSNRATKVKGLERQQRVGRLQAMLDKWYERIPTVFHIDRVADNVGPAQLIQLTKMHHAYLLAEVMTHGVYSHNADWVKRISSFSRAAIEDIAQGNHKNGTPSCHRSQSAPLPEGWSKCVEISRGCMRLFQGATPTECLIWQCSCAHFSSLIILLANMALNPSHELVALDQHLALKALNLFDQLLTIINDEAFVALRAVVGELSQKANAAISAQQTEGAFSSSGVFESLNADGGSLLGSNEPEFLPPDSEFLDADGGMLGAFDVDELNGTVFGQESTNVRGMTQIVDLENFLS
ncbi:fungal-specific transcription factor domain-containing protein [Thelonectria olida]|uniref:Fungal-specific transcription factor domain-containing protein n=1 Tax=Thelonectria olida TaxID=1576542 RepID=A0A9P9AIW2_9HYPO|nr:fungal-specific transcription factor domain-containing protein [Thelonectria olida]